MRDERSSVASARINEAPRFDEALAEARSLYDSGRLNAAERACRQAIGIEPQRASAHRMLGVVLRARGRPGEALKSLQRALELEPRNAATHLQLAISLGEQGLLDEALNANREAIRLQPGYGAALANLAQLKKFHADDPDLALLGSVEPSTLPVDDAVHLLFGLGKAYDDAGMYDRAFDCFERANRLVRARIDYDGIQAAADLAHIAAAFTPEVIARWAGAGSPSRLPILVTGMPRSGTTLVEQILSSHPEVRGAGELPYLGYTAHSLWMMSSDGSAFPDAVHAVESADIRRLGDAYVDRLRSLDADARRVCDKQTHNFEYLGFARMVVPNAQIIHCTRNPLDVCVSCYTLNLDGLPFSYDLQELGEYYRAYHSLMDHWRAVLPSGWMLEVAYEDMVGDIEGMARQIVAHCGLPWDDACLEFYANRRAVRTASFAQVRQPIYRSSVSRWKRYEEHLQPLIAALGDCAVM